MSKSEKELLERLAAESSDGICITDRKGKILYLNAVAMGYGGVSSFSPGMEESQLFGVPAIAEMCVQRRETTVFRKKTPEGRVLLVTSFPVVKEEKKIAFIISFFRENQNQTSDTEIDDNILFIYQSSGMSHMMSMATKLAQIDSTVLISGESGTGKVMLGQYIHRNSSRRSGSFVSLNCAAMPGDLLEQEIFGITGHDGVSEKMGMLALAAGGTLFLDEIDALPLFIQTRLLYTLHDKVYHTVGGRKGIPIECRLIAATDQDLQKLVADGVFRDDLYYLIDVFDVKIPPIRERSMDIVPMIRYLAERYNRRYGLHRRITDGAMDILIHYGWPGNIREMDNTIERLIVMAPEDMIDIYHLPDHLRFQVLADGGRGKSDSSLQQSLDELEGSIIRRSYEEYGSSYRVAQILKISQSKASRLIRKYCTGVND